MEFNQQILNTLRQCVLIQPLDEHDFKLIVQASHVTELEENAQLFLQGSELTSVYLLISGGIKLQRLSPNGDEKVIEIIKPGQTFAEAVLFSGGSRYPVSAVSVSPSVLVAIEAKTYLTLLNSSNSLCLSLIAKLSHRLHWMVNEVDRLTLHSANFRVIDYLLSHIPEDQNDRVGFNLAASKRVIASRLSITPETLSRSLKELALQGLITLDGSQIELINVEQLRQQISL